MEKVLIKDLLPGQKVETYFSVKYKYPIANYKKDFWFRVGVSDRSGEIEIQYWGGQDKDKVEKVHSSFVIDDVVFVSGVVGIFNDKPKIDVNEDSGLIRKCIEGEYDWNEFIPLTNQDVPKMLDELYKEKDSIKNEFLKRLLEEFLGDSEFMEKFKTAPGAMFYHHACIGGLLEHTLGVIKICETLCEIHPSLDRDLIITGAILHDIGKIHEFKITTNIKVSEYGMLRGHVSIGEEMVIEKIKKIENFPELLKSKVIHLIISHHGKMEHGAIKTPQFPEAAAIYLADLCDSQLTQYIRIKKDTETEDFRIFSKSLGEIFLK